MFYKCRSYLRYIFKKGCRCDINEKGCFAVQYRKLQAAKRLICCVTLAFLTNIKGCMDHGLYVVYIDITRKSKTGCFTETVYVEAWCDMQIHEALLKVLYVMKCSLGVPSVMLGRSIFLVYFRYTGRVRNFGYLLQFV